MEDNPLHFLENRDDVLALSTNIIQLEDQVNCLFVFFIALSVIHQHAH
jgi:hypothetical protein